MGSTVSKPLSYPFDCGKKRNPAPSTYSEKVSGETALPIISLQSQISTPHLMEHESSGKLNPRLKERRGIEEQAKRPELKTWVLRQRLKPDTEKSPYEERATFPDQTWTVEGAGRRRGGPPERRHSYKARPFFQKQVLPLFGSQGFDRLRFVENPERPVSES